MEKVSSHSFLTEVYYSGVIQIVDNNHQHAGCGTIIDKQTVVTCSHVVSMVLTGQPNALLNELPNDSTLLIRRPFVDGLDSTPKPATIFKYEPMMIDNVNGDICFIRLKSGSFETIEDISFPIFSTISNPLGIEVAAIGFPKDAKFSMSQSAPAHYNIKDILPTKWFYSVADDGNGNEIRSGFSGGAVRELLSGTIVGIISEADEKRKTAHIIPTSKLIEVHPFVVEPSIIANTNIEG